MAKGKPQKAAPTPAPMKIKRDRAAAHKRRMAKIAAKKNNVARGTARRLRRNHETAERMSRQRTQELKKEGNLIA
jgi:hypothetical protein